MENIFFYKIVFNRCDYDQFDSFIVCANNENTAVSLLLNKYPHAKGRLMQDIDWSGGFTITKLDPLVPEILLGSFNAG